MSKPIPPPATDRELIAEALNEQGYLLQLRILQSIKSAAEGESLPPWRTESVECPVSTAGGEQTRIDIVLAHLKFPNVCLAVECKRANPLYKRWIFFDQTVRPHGYFFDFASDFAKDEKRNLRYVRRLVNSSAVSEVFTFYLESIQQRPGSGKRVSATEAIEDAFQQVTLGQVGLMRKLIQFAETMPDLPPPPMQVIPVVVTTAQLFSADFGHDAVPLETGTIEPARLVLRSHNFVAVNYRINDGLAVGAGLTSNKPTRIGLDLTTQQIRTIFVVHAPHIREFLFWADRTLVDT